MTAAKQRADDGRRKSGEHYGAFMLQQLALLDRLLVSKGWPAISPWWWGVLKRFYMSGRRRFVLRVGRRGGKSSTMCRVAVVETLFGEHVVPPGDVGVFVIIAQDKEQAAERLDTIEDILKAMGVEASRVDGLRPTIETRSFFSRRRVIFRVFPATIKGVSGPTCIGAICDEMAKWEDKDTGANPATEVIRSLKPAMATQPESKTWMISSPFATLDAHYKEFERGDTDGQCVAWAPSWVANPTLTEAGTRADEEDEATWQREYNAIPMSAGTSFFFDHDVIEQALRLALPAGERIVVAGLDAAFRRNAASCVPTARVGDMYGPLDELELVPKVGAPLVPSRTIFEFAEKARACGCDAFVADIHYIESVREHAAEKRIQVHDGFTDKEAAMIGCRVIANGGGFALLGYERLAKQLKGMKQKPTPTGRLNVFSEGASSSSHGDTASAFLAAVDFLAQGGGRIWMPSSLDVGLGGMGDGADNRWENCERGFG